MEGDSRNPRVSLLKKYDIPIDHLSFEYIESCKDKKELERILRILRSGEEGTYPDLTKTAENQLRQIAPDSRVLRVETPALRKESFSSEEWETLQNELLSWEEEMSVMDKGLEFEKKRFDVIGNKNLPEVRKTVQSKSENKFNKETDFKKIKVETNSRNERIRSGDYAAWDKFDVDKELLKIDLDDERKIEKNAKMKREIEKQTKQIQEQKIEPVNIDKDSYSNVEQQILANQAKDRGNECFKSGDYTNALKYYNVSLKLCPTANAYNNRGMTNIKLKNYEEALNDCNIVLKLEPNNVKALHRRATAYQNLSKENSNELALKDLMKIISLEPTNRVAQSDLQSLKKKLNIHDVGKKFSMMIEETDNLAAIRKLPLTYYGPSTSTFKCEPQSMTHRMLSGSNFSGQVMCKCNSNATRQNPLCHSCGERLCRPKPKPKSVTTNQTQGKSEIDSLNEGIKKIDLKSKSESNTENITKPPVIEKSNENVKISQGVNKVQSKSVFDEENEKSKQNLTSNADNEINKNNESERKIEPPAADVLYEKLDEENNKKEKDIGSSTCNEKNREEIKNVINDLKNIDQKLDVENSSNKEIEAAEEKKDESDRNRKFFEELDMSIKERKNKNNEHFKDLAVAQKGKPKNCNMNKASNQKGSSESLPNASSQKETKSETKKSRSKKKKAAKGPRQDNMNVRYPEPVKIVQATKYLTPTTAEPKPEVENTKKTYKDLANDGTSQFKSFVPSRKCGSPESGVLKSSTTVPYSSNLRERDYRMSSPLYGPGNLEKLTKHCEGNKENIIDGNSFENHKNNHVEDGDGSAVIESSFEFMKSWEAMKKTDESYEKRAEIIRVMKPEDLKTVIGNNLDSDMLTSLLECLEKHFLESDPKKVVGMLKELPRIPRFSLVNLFLNPSERKAIERLIETTEEKGFVLDEDVKNSLKLSF